jgi:hypothetical protein
VRPSFGSDRSPRSAVPRSGFRVGGSGLGVQGWGSGFPSTALGSTLRRAQAKQARRKQDRQGGTLARFDGAHRRQSGNRIDPGEQPPSPKGRRLPPRPKGLRPEQAKGRLWARRPSVVAEDSDFHRVKSSGETARRFRRFSRRFRRFHSGGCRAKSSGRTKRRESLLRFRVLTRTTAGLENDDGSLFQGHSIRVAGTHGGGPSAASIEGRRLSRLKHLLRPAKNPDVRSIENYPRAGCGKTARPVR